MTTHSRPTGPAPAPAPPQSAPGQNESLALALLGHDLRAALAEVQNGLELLRDAAVPAPLRDKLDRCQAAGGALSRLIDQSVLVCLGQATPLTTDLCDVSTDAFLDGLVRRWQGRARDGGRHFALGAAPPLPPVIRIDRTALERVLANLIANALCHTPEGTTVTLTIKVSDGDLLLIVVEDDGPGFPPEHLAALQAGLVLPAEARRPGGGYGLQSVRRLVGELGGRFNARNKILGGAEIGICLPLALIDGAAADARDQASSGQGLVPPPPLAPPPDLSGARLLLADDSALCRELTAALAQAIGADLTAVPDGAAAVAALQADGPAPDVLILDDEMPHMTGLEVLGWLQTRSRATSGPRPAVLALTSHIDADRIAALRAAGADWVLSKPVLCPLELGRALLKAQGKPALAAACINSATPDIAAPDTAPSGPGPAEDGPAEPNDIKTLRRLAQLAGPVAALELFDRMAEDLAMARRGLADAARTANAAALRRHSHVIIALAGTAGAFDLHDDAVALNGLAHSDPSGTAAAGAMTASIQRLAERIDLGLAKLLQAVAAMRP